MHPDYNQSCKHSNISHDVIIQDGLCKNLSKALNT